MARYQLTQDAFMPVRPGDFSRRLSAGEEVVLRDDDYGLGPHLKPLDAPARKARAEYDKRRPNATLDPTARLPLGQDPFVGPKLEDLIVQRLDSKLAAIGAGIAPETTAKVAALEAELATMKEQFAAVLGKKAEKAKGA